MVISPDKYKGLHIYRANSEFFLESVLCLKEEQAEVVEKDIYKDRTLN